MNILKNNHEYFMKMALKEAKSAYEEEEIPIGAVIVHNNKVISKGHNQSQRLNDATAHAEMIAITSAQNKLGSKYLNECELYVTLEPCMMCSGAIHLSKINKVVYNNKKAYLKERMPPGWIVETGKWYDRYFNNLVSKINGGINPASIKMLDGKLAKLELKYYLNLTLPIFL